MAHFGIIVFDIFLKKGKAINQTLTMTNSEYVDGKLLDDDNRYKYRAVKTGAGHVRSQQCFCTQPPVVKRQQ